MTQKKHNNKNHSIETQVNRIIKFFNTHEWGIIAVPLHLHKDLNIIVERCFFDCYICMRHAKENFYNGNIQQAKKEIAYSNMWLNEVYDSMYYNDCRNNFTRALYNKTDGFIDKTIEKIFADECPTRKKDRKGFYDFRESLEKLLENA